MGFFADRRWGSDRFTDSIKPVLAFRYQTPHTLAVLGTLETVDRHGLLEPLMVTTRELTTPIEYGMQWIEHRGRFHGNTWINWQKLNTPFQREQFELGTVLGLRVTRVIDLEAQHLWYHRGGQLFDANTPVTNNRVTAAGVVVHDSLAVVGQASFQVAELWSNGHIDPNYPAGRPDKGHGTYVRASATPWHAVELFGIYWRGRDFSGDDGDQNYSSTGHDPAFYRSARKYLELGVMRRVADRRWCDARCRVALPPDRRRAEHRLLQQQVGDFLSRRGAGADRPGAAPLSRAPARWVRPGSRRRRWGAP